MSGIVESWLGGTPPAWMRKLEIAVLMGVFARAFDVEAPSLVGRSADDALTAFREFTAACMEAAQDGGDVAVSYRNRLGAGAVALGRAVRGIVPLRPGQAFAVTRFLYRGIGIELSGAFCADVEFGPCSFAQRYSPWDCWFMSAFDEGFMRGISGLESADLLFCTRLTEGAPCCRASFK